MTPMKPKKNRAGDPYIPSGIDCCQTPPNAIVAELLDHLPLDWLYWEPAAGEGLLAQALMKYHDRQVICSDLAFGNAPRHNFLDWQPTYWDAQITNPPFSIKYLWLGHSYQLGKPFALLLPVETLGSVTAQKLFAKHGMEVILLDKRINFKMPNKGFSGSHAQFPVAWFTWGLNIGRQITYGHVPRITSL